MNTWQSNSEYKSGVNAFVAFYREILRPISPNVLSISVVRCADSSDVDFWARKDGQEGVCDSGIREENNGYHCDCYAGLQPVRESGVFIVPPNDQKDRRPENESGHRQNHYKTHTGFSSFMQVCLSSIVKQCGRDCIWCV